MSNEKERLSLRVSPVTSYRLHTAYRRSGCRSMNELAEKAIGFYLDYLEASNASDFLPTALKSYVRWTAGEAGGAALVAVLQAGGWLASWRTAFS